MHRITLFCYIISVFIIIIRGNIMKHEEEFPILVAQDGDVLGIALAQQLLFLTSDATMPLAEGGLRAGRLLMDQKSRQVWVNQQQVAPSLSSQQFKLLWMLYENQGQI